MLNPSTNVNKAVLERELYSLVSECISQSDHLIFVHRLFEMKFSQRVENEPPSILNEYFRVSLDPAFKERLCAAARDRFHDAIEGQIARFSEAVSSRIIEGYLNRTSTILVDRIERSVEAKDAATLKAAIRDAKTSAKSLCEGYFFYDEAEKRRITPDVFDRAPEELKNLSVASDDDLSENFSERHCLFKIAEAIRLGEFSVNVLERFPHVDRGKLEQDKLLFGAKGANLNALNRAAEELFPFFVEAGLP